jgi:cytochrome c-type biogenesis protein CcmH
VRVNAKRWAWAGLALVVVAAVVVLIVQSQPSNSPHARAQRLYHELACPVCEGQSVADSNSPESRAIREDIPQRIAAGQSDRQIKDVYVQAYGQRILLSPANGGIGLVAWVVPALAVLLGAVGIAFALRRWSRTPRLPASEEDEEIVSRERQS